LTIARSCGKLTTGERMSEFLDQLARNLAEPMPRSRALRLVAVTVAAGALPGLRAGRASAASLATRRTSYTCNEFIPWKCRCPNGSTGAAFERCCQANQQCSCTPTAAICIPCKGRLCLGSNQPTSAGKCCPPNYKCTQKGSLSACCSPEQEPSDGTCKCPKGKKACGPTSCCDPKTEVCLGDECCPKTNLIDGSCCPPGQVARAWQGAARYCCPPNTVPGETGCCPTAIPTCCDSTTNINDNVPDYLPPLPRPGYSHICVSGGWTTFKNP
jgi:hypothetical protein